MNLQTIAATPVQPPVPDDVLRKRLKRGIYIETSLGREKRCSRCKEYWPADTEFFYASAYEIDGLFAWCKACYFEWRYPNGRAKQEADADQTLKVAA